MNVQALEHIWGEACESEWARAAREARASGKPIFDLVNASPLEHGLEYPAALLHEIFSDASAALGAYAPDAKGQFAARLAIAQYHGSDVDPGNILLTPGTSLSYYYAFRALAAGGEEILCPSPSYPLFEDIATLAGVRLRHYHLQPPITGWHWHFDLDDLLFQITPQTRAIVLVSPHNPTGSVHSAQELAAICQAAQKHNLALIFDEVFRESVHQPGVTVNRPTQYDPPLCITINGLSKMLSLPGLKAGWMVVEGAPDRKQSFLNTCEYLSDTLLCVSEITQHVLPKLMHHLPAISTELRAKLTSRMREFARAWNEAGFSVQLPEAGPYLCVPIPAAWRGRDEEASVLLAREGILLHAGSAYGIPVPALVTTCIASPPWPLGRIAAALLGPFS